MSRLTCLWPGLATLGVALAPAPQAPLPAPAPAQAQAGPVSPAELRAQAGVKAYELAWLYYSENRIDSEKVYRWSRRLFEAQRDASVDKSGYVAACQGHLDRIAKLEAKIRKIRRIGFGDSLDVIEVDYYRKEADYWMFLAREANPADFPRKFPDRVDRP